jgi:hypothetical protein
VLNENVKPVVVQSNEIYNDLIDVQVIAKMQEESNLE